MRTLQCDRCGETANARAGERCGRDLWEEGRRAICVGIYRLVGGSTCGHSVCSQTFIDTGDPGCVEDLYPGELPVSPLSDAAALDILVDAVETVENDLDTLRAILRNALRRTGRTVNGTDNPTGGSVQFG